MKVRAGFLPSSATCAAALIGAIAITPQAFAEPADDIASAAWANMSWYHGYLEAGGRFFLNDPQRDGVKSKGGESLAKYYEYSTIKPGAFLNGHLAAGTTNGLYQTDLWAKNVGYSDQSYLAELSKAGTNYLSLGWDQTPHVYSTSARTIYGDGLIIDPTLRNLLSTDRANGPALQTDINNGVHRTDIGIRRDTASVNYRWTPTDAWDIKLAYSHMHRTGTQVDSVPFGTGSSSALAQVPKPVDDTTQNYSLSGEYAGMSFWGQKFNLKLGYSGSTYQDKDQSYTLQNPFCAGGVPGCLANQYDFSRMSLWPSNDANAFSATMGADLPLKSRYIGTISYTLMRQDEAFQPFSTNPASAIGGFAGTDLRALPALSLNGKINTLLINNVLTTQITPDLKSKLSYRYYDYDNQTPLIRFPNGILRNDTATGPDFLNIASIPVSYSKQNAGAELNWRPNREWNLGAAYGYERYNWTYADVDATNENSGKVFADWKAASWVMMRASYLYAARRYGTYDHYNFQGIYQDPGNTFGTQNVAYRQFLFSNRDRQKAQLSVAFDVIPGVTITPTAALRYDNYPLSDGLANQLGLRYDNSWNAGVEVSYVMNPDTTFLASYMREDYNKRLLQTAAIPTDIRDYVDTVTFSVNYAAIPNKLDLTLRIINSWSTSVYKTPTPAAGFSDINTTFLRLDATAKYKLDENFVRQLGWKGDVAVKLRYAWERNSVTNWQNDLMDVYMFTKDPNTINQIYMAYNNPNYNVHLLAASLVAKW